MNSLNPIRSQVPSIPGYPRSKPFSYGFVMYSKHAIPNMRIKGKPPAFNNTNSAFLSRHHHPRSLQTLLSAEHQSVGNSPHSRGKKSSPQKRPGTSHHLRLCRYGGCHGSLTCREHEQARLLDSGSHAWGRARGRMGSSHRSRCLTPVDLICSMKIVT